MTGFVQVLSALQHAFAEGAAFGALQTLDYGRFRSAMQRLVGLGLAGEGALHRMMRVYFLFRFLRVTSRHVILRCRRAAHNAASVLHGGLQRGWASQVYASPTDIIMAFSHICISLEEFRAFCAFFFLLQRRQAEAASPEVKVGVRAGSGATAPMLKLIFAAADVGCGGGTCDDASCDLIGDGRLGKGELRNMLLVLIKESGSLAWLQPQYRADPRFKHMLAHYCKSPLNWTADAALHELLTFDAPPALAAAPQLFTDTSRVSWEGLSMIIETKRQAGGETTIEVLVRRWMDVAIEELSRAAHAGGQGSGGHQRGETEAIAGEARGEEQDCDFDAVAALLAVPVPSAAVPSEASSAPPSPSKTAALRSCRAAPGFPVPVGLSVAQGGKPGPSLRVNSAAAYRFAR